MPSSGSQRKRPRSRLLAIVLGIALAIIIAEIVWVVMITVQN